LTAHANPYVERVIGSIRRECLDHVIVFNERHLRRVLRAYVACYQRSRTHLALGKDAPAERAVQQTGRIVVRPEVGGLHHRYERQAAWLHLACDRRWTWRSARGLIRRHLRNGIRPPTLPMAVPRWPNGPLLLRADYAGRPSHAPVARLWRGAGNCSSSPLARVSPLRCVTFHQGPVSGTDRASIVFAHRDELARHAAR
jgi:Integrase core domain